MDNNVQNQTGQNLDGVGVQPIGPTPVNQSNTIQDMPIDGSAVYNDLPPNPVPNQPFPNGTNLTPPSVNNAQTSPPVPPKKSNLSLWIILIVILLAILGLGYMYIYDIGIFSQTNTPISSTTPLVEEDLPTTQPRSLTTTSIRTTIFSVPTTSSLNFGISTTPRITTTTTRTTTRKITTTTSGL